MDKQLPQGWCDATIADCADLNPKVDKSSINDESYVHFVPMPAVEALSNRMDVSYLRKFSSVKKGYTPFQSEDVLFAKITPCMENGKMVVVPELSHEIAFGSTEFHVLRSQGGISPVLIFHFVSSRAYRAEAEHNMTGAVGQRRVPIDFIGRSRFPLPPLNEQRRIVAKIEELFSEIDAGVASLKTARAQLGVYRQSLLKQAFEGKLTEQWRTQNPDKLEPADQLLARIRSEREARYQQQLTDWQTAVQEWEAGGKEGKKPSKPRPPKDLQTLDSELLSELSSLPHSWGWDKLGWMTCGSEYGSSAKSEKEGKCPVIRMGNIQRGELDWDDLVYSNNQEEIDQYLLSAGDVLFNRTNSPEWVGKTAIYRGTRPAIFAGYLIRVNQINSIVESSYLNYYLNSHTARQYGNTVKTDGVNQSNINGDKLVNYPFPFCSLPEQQEIVRILEEQFTAIEQNEQEIDAAVQRAEALRQSILKKAFAGKLVDQDPNDEPASVLLERIRSEREVSEAELKAKKKASKKAVKTRATKKSIP